MPFLFFLLWLWRMEMLCFPNLLHVADFLHNLQNPLTQNRGKNLEMCTFANCKGTFSLIQVYSKSLIFQGLN